MSPQEFFEANPGYVVVAIFSFATNVLFVTFWIINWFWTRADRQDEKERELVKRITNDVLFRLDMKLATRARNNDNRRSKKK